MEKFRVISDLHLDINKCEDIGLYKDDIFTVIAGDTSGQRNIVSATFLPNNTKAFYVSYDNKEVVNFLKSKNVYKQILTYNEKTNSWFDEDNIEVDNEKCDIYVSVNPYMRLMHFKDEQKNLKIPNGQKLELKYFNALEWIKNHISKGLIIAGNHLGYNFDYYTLDEQKDYYSKNFPKDGDISFLDVDAEIMTKEVDGILFIGSTLFTDYTHINKNDRSWYNCAYSNYNKEDYKNEIVAINMNNAYRYMNDFRTCIKEYDEKQNDYIRIKPDDYLEIFNRTYAKIKEIVKNNPDKEIVIVTHHCPSDKCIANDYSDSRINASYVSNLEKFILEHKNIKCWVCGHIHYQKSFKIGDCLVVMNPYGYSCYKENENFDPNLFVNTETWEVEKL